MSSETLINTACNPTPLLPGSGLETKLQLHHNGVMTYSHYVNGSIFSVPKFEVVAKNNHNSTGFDVMGHPVKASDHLVETVYGLVKFFLGWDYYSIIIGNNHIRSEKFKLLINYPKDWKKNTFSLIELLVKFIYRTRAIISRGLHIFYPISKDHFFVFKEVFSENSVFMYGLYSRAAFNQEWLMMVRVLTSLACYRPVSLCTIAYKMHEEVFLFQNIIIEVKS